MQKPIGSGVLQISSACHHNILRRLVHAASGILYLDKLGIQNLELQMEILLCKWRLNLQRADFRELAAVYSAFSAINKSLNLSEDKRAQRIRLAMLTMRSTLLYSLHVASPRPLVPKYASVDELTLKYRELIAGPSDSPNSPISYDLFALFLENEAIAKTSPTLLVALLLQLVESKDPGDWHDVSRYFKKLLRLIKRTTLPGSWHYKFWSIMQPHLGGSPNIDAPHAQLIKIVYRVQPGMFRKRYFEKHRNFTPSWIYSIYPVVELILNVPGGAKKRTVSTSSLQLHNPTFHRTVLLSIDFFLWIREDKMMAYTIATTKLMELVRFSLSQMETYQESQPFSSALAILFSDNLYNLLNFYLTHYLFSNVSMVPNFHRDDNKHALYRLLRQHVSDLRTAAVVLKVLGPHMEPLSTALFCKERAAYAGVKEPKGSPMVFTQLQHTYFHSRVSWATHRTVLFSKAVCTYDAGTIFELLQGVAYILGDQAWGVVDQRRVETLLDEWTDVSDHSVRLAVILRLLEILLLVKEPATNIHVNWLS